ncbi:transcriptional regulator [Brachybacterium ginsengisoli]|uniref:Transcriptional regulator n=1 Tax=Brachybacterium ginsengisoli TaxID=1331682 RepID=A0A291GVU3_9MICO|nr:helix-turn-helix domain-containing protein [Brachybacterium ginsengisoli]ATG54214.1 transcriptional regulator [Brachybacterium ginsengisoli]
MALIEYDPYVHDCPSRRLLDRIGDRWTVLLIGTLEDGPMRFSQLSRRVDGISQKMLTQTLRSLEADGLVVRTAYPEIPPRVEYELTDLGRSLLAPLQALVTWASEHMAEVQDSRDRSQAA